MSSAGDNEKESIQNDLTRYCKRWNEYGKGYKLWEEFIEKATFCFKWS